MLDDSAGPKLLTYQEAAHRVGCKVRTVWRWRKNGMPMSHGVRDGQHVRLVDETVLLAWWRDTMKADVRHRARMRRLLADEGEPLPDWLLDPPRRRPTLNRQELPVAPTTGDKVSPDPDPEPDEADPDDSAVTAFVPALTTAELLTTLQLKTGAQEYSALTTALRRGARVACADEPLFTADTLSPLEQRVMEGICAECPMLELCAAFAEASRPASGFWAGESWPKRGTRDERAA